MFYVDCVNICKNNVIYGRISNSLLNIYKYLCMCLDTSIRLYKKMRNIEVNRIVR
jgi:hypothetical protein